MRWLEVAWPCLFLWGMCCLPLAKDAAGVLEVVRSRGRLIFIHLQRMTRYFNLCL